MNLDEIDIKILKENFDEELITQIDTDNVSKIFKEKLGADFANKLGEDSSLIEIMYE